MPTSKAPVVSLNVKRSSAPDPYPTLFVTNTSLQRASPLSGRSTRTTTQSKTKNSANFHMLPYPSCTEGSSRHT